MLHPNTFQRLADRRRDDLVREAARDHLISPIRRTVPQPREPWRRHVALGLAEALVSAGTRLQHHHRPVADECATC